MFGLFKKRGKQKCKLQHFKRAGETYKGDMICVIRLDERRDEWGRLDYAIYQCRGCGKRAFQCLFYHFLETTVTIAIDDFISYKITLEELTVIFDKNKIIYERT
jgi:hypothetical protein